MRAFFLDTDNGFGVFEALTKPGVFATKRAEIGDCGLGDLRLGATPYRLECLERAGIPLAARSVSSRMRSLAAAENVRRRGRGESSGDAADGGGTVVGLRPSFGPAVFAVSIGPSELGITTMSFSCAQA